MPRSIDEWARDRNRSRGGESVGSSIVGAVGGKTGDGSISGSIVGAVGGQSGGSVGGSIAGAVQQQTGQSGGQGSPRSIEEWAQDQQRSKPQTLDEGQRLYEQRKQAQAEAQPWKPTLLWLGEMSNQAEQARLGQQIRPQENATTWEDVKDAWEASRTANRVIDYAGRDKLIKEYNAARHEMGAQRHTPEPEVQQRYEQARDRLYEQERIHGNIGLNANGELQTMSYSFGEGVGNVIGGTMGRVIGGVGSAATWLGEAAARSEYAKSAAQLREMEAFYAMAGNDNASEGAARMADTLTQRAAQRGNLEEFGGAYSFFDKQAAAGNRLVQAAKENQRPVVQMGVDVGSTALEMGFDAVSGIPLVSMGVRVFGGASQEARDAGADFLQQGAYGAASASIEVMTETIGGLKLYGGGQLDEVLEPALREIAGTSGGYALLRAMYTMVQEGNEEVLSDLLQPLAQSIYNGQSVGENYSQLELQDILYDWLLGAAAAFGGAVVESGGYAQDYKAMREMQQDLSAHGVETGRMTDEQLRQAYTLDKAGVNVAGLQSAENRAVGGETIGEAYENMTPEQRQEAVVNMLRANAQQTRQTPTDNITRETAQEILRESLGDREAESAERILDLGSESNLREQAIAYHTIATEYGQNEGRSVEDALRSNVRGALNDTQVQHAYAYGESLRKSGQAVGVNGQVTEQGAQTAKPARRAGLVTAGTFADGSTTYKAADLSKADARDLRILNDIAKAQGVDFVLYESELGEADAEGRRRYIGANGAYRNGVVYLDINAGLTGERTEGGKTYSIGQRALLVTAAHELTHHLEHSNAAMYRQLRSFVTERLGGSDSFIGYVKDAMARENIGVEAASREVVARACEEVLLDEDAIRELQGKKPTLWEQIKEWVKDFVKKFQSPSGDAVEMRQYADELRRLWLDTATETPTDLRGDIVPANAPAVDPANAPEETFTASGANGQQYSLRSMSHDIAEGKMFSDLRQYCGWTQEQTDTLKKNLQGLVQYMSQYAGIVDMNESYDKGNRPYSAYKPNSDPLYTISLDFSTLCRKRLLTQHIMEQLQLQLIDAKSGKQGRILTAEEQMAIRDMLEDYAKQEKALKVACAMCYVEAARLKAPAQMERIIGDMGSVMIDYYAKQSDIFKGQTRSAQNRWKVEHGYSATDTKAAMTNKDRSAFNKASKEFRASYTPTAAEMEVVERARNLPRTAFLSAENLTRLYTDEQTRDIYKAYTNKLRESTHSKGLETDIPYYYGDSAESVSDTFIRNVVRENGMRFSSWSDFQMKHVLDMMTAVIELSTRKCSMHGYTKFLEAVRLFGRTGMMFNMSGVPAGNGFTEDGQLAFSKTESVLVYGENGEYDAIRARREFPETAGLQCIGISRAHILALLDSDIIDYIIPYHTSGLNAKLRKMAGINNWDDFQGFQNATVDKSIEQGNCPNDIWHKEPVFSEFFAAAKDPANGYKEGEAGIDTMRRAAEQYKQMCRERGLRPKFSWANSKVDANFADHPDYWKLLIDRKMINQETGKLIEQKPVEPNFDFAEIKRAVDEEVAGYDAELEDKALAYVKEHLDELPGRVKELKAKGSQNAHEAQRPTTLDRHVMDMSNGLYAAEASGLRNPTVTGNAESKNAATETVQHSVRSDAMTDREILMLADAYGEGQTELAEFRDAMARYQNYDEAAQEHLQKLGELQQERKTVTDMRTSTGEITPQEKQQRLDALDKQIASERKEATKAEQNASRALSRVTQLEKGRALQDILVKERAEQRQRTRDKANERLLKRDARKTVEKRAKVLYDMLMKNSDKQHVPEMIKEPLGAFLAGIDFSSNRLLEGKKETKRDAKFGAALQKISTMLNDQQAWINGDENAKNGDFGAYLDISEENLTFLKDCSDLVTQALSENQTFTVNQMSGKDLKALGEFLQNLTTAIRNMNNFMANARFESVREAADADIEHMKALGKASERAGSGLSKTAMWDNGTPYYVLKRFGDGAKALFDSLAKGWEKMAFNAKEIIDFTAEAYTTKEVNAWKSEMHDFTLEDGSEIRMTTAQIMALSAMIGREQARKHIEQGGIRIGDIKTKKGEIHDTTHYHFSEADIAKVIGSLTDRQAEVAGKLQKFMAKKGAEWGNEVSMKRFGYRFYTEGDAYYPIKTDSNDRPMADTDAQENSMFRLLNLSSSKSLNPKASNALIVDDIFDTFADHMADMAKLNGLGLPVLDAIKWFNYKERIDRGDGTYDTKTLQGAMEQAFGKQAQRYFSTLMKDINGVKESGDRGGEWQGKLISNYKVAAVGANLRVMLLQPTSYVRALTLIKPRYLAGAIFSRNAYKEALKYSGTAVWKALGYYDTNISRSMREQIQHSDSFGDQVKEITMTGAEFGDKWTWGGLWVACKMQARAETKLSGEELNRATADLFREVIYSSQVMDSTLTRSQSMRASGKFTKLKTAFMAEPTLSYNILLDAYSQTSLDIREYGRREGWKRNTGKMAHAFAVYAVSASFSALVESFVDALRDDDDEEFVDKFLDALIGEVDKAGKRALLKGNLMQDLTIIGKIPELKDLISLFQGYGSRDMSVTALGELKDAYEVWRETVLLQKGILDKATKTTYYGNMTMWGKIYKTLTALSHLSGYAVSNLTRDALALWNTFVPSMKIKTYEGRGAAAQAQRYIEAYRAEDRDKMREISNGLGTDRSGFNSQLSAEIRSEYMDGDISEAQAIRMLQELRGLSNHEAQDKLREWKFEKAQGYAYDKLKQTYIDGGVSEAQAMTFLRETGGKTQSEAERTIKEWKFEKAQGYAYDKLKQTYLNGGVSEAQAMTFLQEIGDKTQIEAERTIKEWEFEKAQGYPYDKLKQTYIDGGVSEAQAMTFLQETGDKTQSEAERTMREWKFEKAQGYAYSDLKGWYVDGKVSQADAIRYVQEVTLKGLPDVQETVLHWQCLKDTGIDYDKIDERLQGGEITLARAAGLWQKYGGMSAEDAKLKANYVTACGASPGLKDKLTQGQYNAWYNYARSAGVKVEVYANIRSTANTDDKSSISQSEAAAAITRALNAGQITRAQAEAIWKSFNKSWTTTYASYAARHK